MQRQQAFGELVGDPSYRRSKEPDTVVGRQVSWRATDRGGKEKKKRGQEKMGERNSANRTKGGERRRKDPERKLGKFGALLKLETGCSLHPGVTASPSWQAGWQ